MTRRSSRLKGTDRSVLLTGFVMLVLVLVAGAILAAAPAAAASGTSGQADVDLAVAAGEAEGVTPADDPPVSTTGNAAEEGTVGKDGVEVSPERDTTPVSEEAIGPATNAAIIQYGDGTSGAEGASADGTAETPQDTVATAEGASAITDSGLAADHDGDGRTEVTVLYDMINDTAALYVFEPTDTGYSAPQRVWQSSPGAWDWWRSTVVATDHDGDGRTEVTVLYNLYNDNAGLYVFEPTDTGFAAPQRVWLSAPRAWDWKRSKTPGYNFTLKTYNLGIA